MSPEVVAKSIKDIRELASKEYKRNPDHLKFLALITPVLGRTLEEAQAKFKEYRACGSVEGAYALVSNAFLSIYGLVNDNSIRSSAAGPGSTFPNMLMMRS